MNPQGTAEYNSLNWVKKQLDTVLTEAQSSLSAYIEDSSEDSQLQECIDGLRLVYGTLQMVEIYGAAMLTEEMEQTAKAVLDGRIDNRDDAYDVLMRAMLQLPDYLESLQSGHKDNPIALMPLMNDLRAVRKDNLLSENVLFFPDVETVEIDETELPIEVEEGKLQAESKRLRTHFQLGLLDVLKNDKLQNGCKRMLAVLIALEKVTGDASIRRLWLVASALVEGLFQNGIDLNVSTKQLLGGVDRQIKLLVDIGEVEFADRFSQELLKNILYYVGHSTSKGPRVIRVREKYKLDELLAAPDESEAHAAGIGGLNAELFETVSQGIKEDLAQVKDALEIFVHGADKDVASLAPIAEQVGRIGDTYGMLGLGSTRQTVLNQRELIENIARGSAEPSDEAIMAIAGELLAAESDLENYIARRSGAAVQSDDEDRIVPAAEYREVLSTVIRQGLENFTDAKEAILSYTSGIGNQEQLHKVMHLLEEVRGVTMMLPMSQVENLISRLMDYVRIALIDNVHQPDDTEQDTVADVVTSIEYYLEAITEGRPGVEEGLKAGEAAADKLAEVYCQYEPAAVAAEGSETTVAAEPGLKLVEPATEAEETAAETTGAGHAAEAPQDADTQTVEEIEEIAVGKVEEDSAAVVTPDGTTEASSVISSIDSERPEEEYAILGDDADEEILEIFIEEAIEVLGELNENLPAWRANPGNEEALAVVRRAFHTLKGSGRLIGAELIGEFSWKFENMLNRVIEGKIQPDDKVMNSLDEAVNVLPQLIEQLNGNREPVPNIYQLMKVADALAEGREPETVQPAALEASVTPPAETEEIEVESLVPEVTAATDMAGETVPAEPETAPETAESEQIDLEAVEMEGVEDEFAEFEIAETMEAAPAGETEEEAITPESPEHTGLSMEEALAPETTETGEVVPETDLHVIEPEAQEETITPESGAAEQAAPEPGMTGEAPAAIETIAPDDAAVAESLELAVEDLDIDTADTPPAIAAPEIEAGKLGAEMDPVLFRIYYDESVGHLEQVNAALNAHAETGQPVLADKDMVRAFHTLFGSARTAEIDEIAEICGVTEKYLKTRQEGESNEIPEAVLGTIAEVAQTVRRMLDGIREGVSPEPQRPLHDRMNAAVKAELQQQLQQTSRDGSPRSVEPEAAPETDEISEALVRETLAQQPPVQQEAAPAPEAIEISYADIDEDLIDIFLEEADELLESCEEVLLKISADPNNEENIRQLQRYMHTLKGGARMAELKPVGDLTHNLESLVIKVADRQVQADKQLFDTLNDSVDRLAAMLKDVKNRAPVTSAADLLEYVECLMRGERIEQRAVERFDLEIDDLKTPVEDSQAPQPAETAPVEAAVAEEKKAPEPPRRRASDREEAPHWGERATDVNFRESHEQIRVRADLLNNLVNSAGEVNIYHARMVKQMSDIAFNLNELDSTVVRLKQQLRNLEIETEIQIRSTYEKEHDQYDEDFDPLEMDRYSTMQQLSRSLSETASDVESIRTILGDIVRDSETLLLQESRVSTELQEGLMRTRMVRFGGLGTRLRRIVRQTARELHKDVELEMAGDNNELDRTVLDRIIAPLEHMLRNAVAHGIELPEKRAAAGKPESGTIVISVDRQGADVVIRVRDDGQGINADTIRKKAVRQGLLEEDSKLTDHDVLQFILKSGFSTADEVTQVAGRGVGMDVVDTELKQLGGLLEINTWPGKGTEFTVRLPLTLAINQALLVSTADDIYAIPLASIEGVVRVTGAELQQFYNSEQKLYEFNNVQYELKHLGKMLTGTQPDYSKQYNLFPVLLAQVGDQHYALHVDDLVGRREIVVKPVGHQISSVRGIAGATILADGRVVLIIEMSALVVGESLFAEPEEGGAEAGQAPAAAPETEKLKTIMVVDDSITIRKVTARMLERNGINVLLAKDGVDATNQLVDHIPDLMLLDIEMPRMDGFELASYIRNDDRLKDIPIIMITSRTGTKHKDKAMEIGVNQYLGKPYQEEELMKNINEFI